MRLSAAETAVIKDVVRATAGAGAQVRLFGSRLDDGARGGDIELLVDTDEPVEHALLLGARIAAGIELALGEQRIDVVLGAPNLAEQAIHAVARRSGRLL